jgi:hypothetical protein
MNKIVFDKESSLEWKTRNVWDSKFLAEKFAATYKEKYPEAYMSLEEGYVMDPQTGEDIWTWAVVISFSSLADEALFILNEVQ